ncbi:MAG TPA: PBP1A family penicillin-binding protein [Thermoanaerobaculia bacterium]|nr:PBP1A family penicillin-binding protein [Thermoanaerobaculia bacterium]
MEPPRQPPRQRASWAMVRSDLAAMERRQKIAVVGGFAMLALSVAVGLWLAGWLVQVSRRFPEAPFRQPSRLYARPEVLAVGEPIATSAVLAELRDAGYREWEADGPLPPGTFRRSGGRLALHLRPFPDRAGRGRPGESRPVLVDVERGRVARVLIAGRPAARVELEPALLASYYGPDAEERRPVTLAELPDEVVQTVLAAEDHAFFLHPGFSAFAIARAAWANFRGGAVEQGGSTLTQQLVKNLYLSPERTLARKAREAVLAVLLEARFGKKKILEAYLNEIYWGSTGSTNLIGLGAAARAYFGKDAAALRLEEAAILAGMIRAPANYSPLAHPEAARRRRDWVLGRMAELGWIEEDRAARLAALPLAARPRPASPRRAPYFADAAAAEARRRYDLDDLAGGGYVLFATLSWREQELAEEAVAATLPALERRWERRRRKAPLQAALVSADPRDGAILAYVGGRDYRESQFDRAARARRQAGSAFKPVVYAAAFAEGAAYPATVLRDTPIVVRYGTTAWRPQNDDRRFRGPVTVRRALEQSLNIPTVRLAMQVGLTRVADLARAMGVSTPLAPVPALALGAAEVTPWDLTEVYATLASGGARPPLHGLSSVFDRFGEEVLGEDLAAPQRVLHPQPAYLVTALLQGAVDHGTGAAARGFGVRGPIAGKTGTTNGRRDSWFAGYSGDRVTVVWVGYDDNARTRLSGARAAVPLWARFTRAVRPPGGFRPVPQPSGIVSTVIDPETGELATDFCPARVTEVFADWQAPSQPCRLHAWRTQMAWVDPNYDPALYDAWDTRQELAADSAGGSGYGNYGYGDLEGVPLEEGAGESEPRDAGGLRGLLRRWPDPEDPELEEESGEIVIRPSRPAAPLEPEPVPLPEPEAAAAAPPEPADTLEPVEPELAPDPFATTEPPALGSIVVAHVLP